MELSKAALEFRNRTWSDDFMAVSSNSPELNLINEIWKSEWTGVSVLPIWKVVDDSRPWEGMKIPLFRMFSEPRELKDSDNTSPAVDVSLALGVSLGGGQLPIGVPETQTGAITRSAQII
jgi:hypothetical protein